MTAPTLSDYIEFLARPGSYADPTTAVEIRQTHISVVAIADTYVYKLKKPVRFDFLNFSTPKRRLHFCKEEIRLNRRLSPSLYVDLLPVYFYQGRLQFYPEGRVVNYVIQMHRLSEEGLLVNQIRRPAFSLTVLDRVAATLIRFYRQSKATLGMRSYGSVRQVRRLARAVTPGTGELEQVGMPASTAYSLFQYLSGFPDSESERFLHRMATRRIVEGHGDLRCEHIHIEGSAVNIYDCLEFDRKLRCLDWLNDIAFLLMDLEYRRCRHLAGYLETKLLNALETEDVGALLTFYKTYRACVRGKVNRLKAAETEVPEPEREASRQKARRYYQLALRYSLLGSAPTVVVCLGSVASGKSTLAAALASWLGVAHLSSDRLRKQQAGVEPLTRLPDPERAQLYTPAMTDQVYNRLTGQALQEVKLAGAAMVDATYREPRHLQALRDQCRQEGIRLLVIQTQASEALILQRLRSREGQATVSDLRLSDYAPETFHLSYAVADLADTVLPVDTGEPVDQLIERRVFPWFREAGVPKAIIANKL
ncbi:bifunctional aminoglycoside phosphotransferase/ATP-binding protein [Nibrella viscosa]|uniref:Bifunctional aminoglycoside phosphotransferase/ATP-binding protein n=1 Tax=Nibrella viscosa TaxID=1084524 RepID=A0ABP8KR57_9BACT